MNNIQSLNSDKFKSVLVSVTYLIPYDRADFSKLSVLRNLLEKSTKTYDSEQKLAKQKAKLYDTHIDVDVDKFSTGVTLSFNMEAINTKALNITDGNNIKQALMVLFEMIEEPNTTNNMFPQEEVEAQKLSAIEAICELEDNKKRYALSKLEQNMFEGAYSKSILGEKEAIQKLSGAELYKYYEEIKEEGEVFVQTIGNLCGYERIGRQVYNRLKNDVYRDLPQTDYLKKAGNQITCVEEKQDVNQSVITIGLKFEEAIKDPVETMQLYAHLLGGTPSSKLFQNVREKNSLAYFSKAVFNKQQKVIYMFSGVAPKNEKKAIGVMEEQLVEIKKGNITEEEFLAAKDSLIATYEQIKDDKQEIARVMFSNFNIYGEWMDESISVEKIKKIKKQEIIDIANKVVETTMFVLGGKQDG